MDEYKRAVAIAAAERVGRGSVIGVGTGSTANHFIDALASRGVAAAVASSSATEERLRRIGVEVVDLDAAGELELYVDGADETDAERRLIKGGGGALTREKIVAEASRRFVCIVDESKVVARLGRFPLPVEVLPMALGLVTRRLAALGGDPRRRADFVTDNGNAILDVPGLDMTRPDELEAEIERIPGVVACGLFCRRRADVVLVGGPAGVRELST